MKNLKRVITWVLVCSIMFTNLPNLQNTVYAFEKEKTISKLAPLFDIYPYFDEDTKELLVINLRRKPTCLRVG